MPTGSWLPSYLASFVVAFFIGGPLGEEPGWDGRQSPSAAALRPSGRIIDPRAHYVLWHLPLFWIPQWGTARDTVLDIVWYGLAGIALTVVYTWLFNRTKGSVLLTTLATRPWTRFSSASSSMPRSSVAPAPCHS